MPTVGDEFHAAASLLRTEVDAEGQVQGLQQVSQNQLGSTTFLQTRDIFYLKYMQS
jgi:hypothetical protein